MSIGRAIDQALTDHPGGSGEVSVEKDGGSAVVDVADVDRLGVRLRKLKVTRREARDPLQEVASLPERLRSLPERVVPIEVDPHLGGGTLRTAPGEVRDREFFEIDVRGERDVEVRRYKATEGGREEADWVVTRKQLERLIDEIDS